uniref:Putative secreted protein n=1 Tax=Amblyomma triste TaxID=251400 RepID=A0A023G353_AMBTT
MKSIWRCVVRFVASFRCPVAACAVCTAGRRGIAYDGSRADHFYTSALFPSKLVLGHAGRTARNECRVALPPLHFRHGANT